MDKITSTLRCQVLRASQEGMKTYLDFLGLGKCKESVVLDEGLRLRWDIGEDLPL